MRTLRPCLAVLALTGATVLSPGVALASPRPTVAPSPLGALRAAAGTLLAPAPLVVTRAATAPAAPAGARALLDAPAPAPAAAVAAPGAAQSTWTVTYDGFPAAARDAFQRAVDTWAAAIYSPVPLTVSAHWGPLPTDVLGSAGAGYIATGFPGQPVPSTWYPAGLANRHAGVDLVPDGTQDTDGDGSLTADDGADVVAFFNSDITAWNFAAGQAPGGTFDLETVVLHEIGHGLGFFDSAGVDEGAAPGDGLGYYGYDAGSGEYLPVVYDRYLQDAAGTAMVDQAGYPNPDEGSPELYALLTGDALYLGGAGASGANPEYLNARPRVHSPDPYEPGSSIGHLREQDYPASGGDPANALMTPTLAPGETIHSPGAITLGLFADLGWTAGPDAPPPVVPEAPLAALLPVLGLVAGAVALRRRRLVPA